MTDAKFFIDKPEDLRTESKDGFPLYRDSDGNLLKWSGAIPLPGLNQRVWITMNRIGWAVVKGWFSEAGFVGVMTEALEPPAWLVAQRKRQARDMKQPLWDRQGIGCEVGAENAGSKPEPQPLPVEA